MIKKAILLLCALSMLLGCVCAPAAADTVDGEEAQPRELKLLFFGNSFTFSTLGYLPQLLEEALPGVNVTMGITYTGSCSFSTHVDLFEKNKPYTLYAEYKSENGRWNSYEELLSAKMILLRDTWDIIGLQQSVENLHDFNGLEQFADLISSWIDYPVAFVYNMAQARHANDVSFLSAAYPDLPDGEARSDAHFASIADYARRAKEGVIICDVLPCATAVQNLRTVPAIKELGNNGYLAYDEGGHLHHGLGMLAASYAACYKILEIIGALPKLYGLQFMPSDNYIQQIHFVGNGSACVGITPENMLLAKKCAMLACKKPFELSDCSSLPAGD